MPGKMKFKLAAIIVLHENGNKPMHYTDIYEEIKSRGLTETSGATPSFNVLSAIRRDISSKKSHFVALGNGMYTLKKGVTPKTYKNKDIVFPDEDDHGNKGVGQKKKYKKRTKEKTTKTKKTKTKGEKRKLAQMEKESAPKGKDKKGGKQKNFGLSEGSFGFVASPGFDARAISNFNSSTSTESPDGMMIDEYQRQQRMANQASAQAAQAAQRILINQQFRQQQQQKQAQQQQLAAQQQQQQYFQYQGMQYKNSMAGRPMHSPQSSMMHNQHDQHAHHHQQHHQQHSHPQSSLSGSNTPSSSGSGSNTPNGQSQLNALFPANMAINSFSSTGNVSLTYRLTPRTTPAHSRAGSEDEDDDSDEEDHIGPLDLSSISGSMARHRRTLRSIDSDTPFDEHLDLDNVTATPISGQRSPNTTSVIGSNSVPPRSQTPTSSNELDTSSSSTPRGQYLSPASAALMHQHPSSHQQHFKKRKLATSPSLPGSMSASMSTMDQEEDLSLRQHASNLLEWSNDLKRRASRDSSMDSTGSSPTHDNDWLNKPKTSTVIDNTMVSVSPAGPTALRIQVQELANNPKPNTPRQKYASAVLASLKNNTGGKLGSVPVSSTSTSSTLAGTGKPKANNKAKRPLNMDEESSKPESEPKSSSANDNTSTTSTTTTTSNNSVNAITIENNSTNTNDSVNGIGTTGITITVEESKPTMAKENQHVVVKHDGSESQQMQIQETKPVTVSHKSHGSKTVPQGMHIPQQEQETIVVDDDEEDEVDILGLDDSDEEQPLGISQASAMQVEEVVHIDNKDEKESPSKRRSSRRRK